MTTLTVHRISGLSYELMQSNAANTNHLRVLARNAATVGGLKRLVAAKFGVPEERHRYYGVWGINLASRKFRFGREILGDNDGECLVTKLLDLYRRHLILSWSMIGVVFVPAEEDDDVQLVRRVSTVREHMEEGRDDAVETDDDSGLESFERDSGPPRPKRARRTMSHSGAEDLAGGNPPAASSAGKRAPAGANHANPGAAPVRGEGAGNIAESDNHNTARASERREESTVPGAAPGVQAARDAPTPSLRQWLRSLGAYGANTNRFDAYIPAFEREFNSLEDLALAVDNPRHGVESTLQACGVNSIGDKARIEWAIAELPRPRHS